MRIVFDMQACQAPDSRVRGIGRYTLAHVRAFVELASEHEVILVLNNSFSESIEWVRQDFADILDPSRILVFSTLGGLSDMSASNQWRHDAAHVLYEDFIRALKPDVFHVTSLFEGFNDAVTGILPNHGGINSITLYDLIPYQYADIYLPTESLQNWYLRKLQALKSADLLLAISGSSRQEGIDLLGVPSQQVVNISSAIGEHFCERPVSAQRKAELQVKFDLRDDYLLYTGGIDSRKNIEGLITAYAMLPITLRDRHQLAIVCSCNASNRERLMGLAKAAGLPLGQLVLTGFVSEEELVDLYNLAKLFIFPSLHEGFGLPALEAMACGIPTLVSNTSSLPEVVAREDMQFDPRDFHAMSQAIIDTLGNAQRMADLREHGLKQAGMFSWKRTAEVTLQAFEAAFAEKNRQQPYFTPAAPLLPGDRPQDGRPLPGPRPRLAFVSPLPPEESGIADYSAELLPELARYYEIDIVTPQSELTDRWVRGNFPCRTPEWFSKNASRYQRVLYHFGNSSFHSHMFSLLEQIPGTVVLHDFYLSGILNYLELTGAETDCFTRALYVAHGYSALQAFHQDRFDCAQRYPANLGVLSQAQGVIVHSEHSRTLANAFYGPDIAKDWVRLPLLRVPKMLADRLSARQRLGLPDDSQITATFGFLAPTKLNLELIDAWLKTQEDNPDAWLVLVGRNSSDDYGRQIEQRIKQSRAASRIKITGFATTEDYSLWLAAADVTVQLRTGSRGETSAALYDCISAGKPLIYNANGSSAELPENVAVRLPDAFEQDHLAQTLRDLLAHPDQAAQFGAAALAFRDRLSPAKVALQYWQTLEHFAQDHPLVRQRQLLERLRLLPEHAQQPLVSHLELACAVTQNIDHAQLPYCYIDVSNLVEGQDPEWDARLASLLVDPIPGWRVELVENIEGIYQLACRRACRLLAMPECEDRPLLTRRHDAWIHVGQATAPHALWTRLGRVGVIETHQTGRLTQQSLTDWLLGQAFEGITGN
jgi:glycosyltransferase involved in cell wall biosynthesis